MRTLQTGTSFTAYFCSSHTVLPPCSHLETCASWTQDGLTTTIPSSSEGIYSGNCVRTLQTGTSFTPSAGCPAPTGSSEMCTSSGGGVLLVTTSPDSQHSHITFIHFEEKGGVIRSIPCSTVKAVETSDGRW